MDGASVPNVWEGKLCPACGGPLEAVVELLRFHTREGPEETYIHSTCAQLALQATWWPSASPDDREHAAGSLIALLARSAGRKMVR